MHHLITKHTAVSMTNLVLERVMKIHFLFPVTYTKPEKEDMGRSYMYTFDIVHIGVLYE